MELPGITLSEEEIASIKADLGVPAQEVIGEPESDPLPVAPIKRKRGRPRKHPLPESLSDTTQPTQESPSPNFPPAPLTKRDEREVASRLVSMLQGGTGILGQAKPYLEMTEEEAKAIAEPLSSYLVRNADTTPVARQILENYDLLAIVLGVMAYVARVYHDRSEEVKASAAANPVGTKTLDRISELTSRSKAGQEVRESDFVSTPNGSWDGSSPYTG